MGTQFESQQRTMMFAENIFEGWLSMPSMEALLNDGTEMSSEHSTTTISPQSQRQEDIAFGITQADPPARNETPKASKNTPVDDAAGRKRRGHTKSRLGCISCKKRKIKCQEIWPSCTNCVKRGCACRYPTVFKHTQHDRIVSEVMSSPRQFVKLSETPKMFSANDMRLFHHFLIAAHPCIPIKHESVWIQDMPTFSHHYDYLMHAILALAGSHLSMFIDDPRGNMALSHRQTAIKGLEEAFARWPPKADEAHVMLATSYLLAFQAGYMPDGFLDNILSLRGCAFLSQFILSNRLEGAFSVEPNLHSTGLELKLRNFPSLDQTLVRNALRSTVHFSHLLEADTTQDIEKALFAQLVESIRPLCIYFPPSESPDPPASSRSSSTGSWECSLASRLATPLPSPTNINNPILPGDLPVTLNEVIARGRGFIEDIPPGHVPDPFRALNALMSTLVILTTWPQDAVLHLMSPSNKLGMITMAHFGAIRIIVTPLSAPESALNTPVKAMIEWCEKIIDAVEDDENIKWSQYVEWPATIFRTLRGYLNQKHGLTLGDIHERLVKDAAAFLEGRPGCILR
ncbi:uncharacterized protein BDR25DRAFT_306977 [Lindgomyces ingoldianus]|uniref:Uncharacterized protein n=1 Tax=Lindgomyces ingoldianus TaxID=673940 RepID=A0ACB6QD12_9PLEO|nr:uncharacterized protein BDR25DRAFT_306977 [Lindgomyces ingoldianus]KAF2464909.1 hypothetical protein BDR25DRAFT_306977 [Lindgomyces ingoldianus]